LCLLRLSLCGLLLRQGSLSSSFSPLAFLLRLFTRLLGGLQILLSSLTFLLGQLPLLSFQLSLLLCFLGPLLCLLRPLLLRESLRFLLFLLGAT
jgi:hypothetical protein